MSGRRHATLIALLVSCLGLAPAGSQVVRGSVVDSTTGRPVLDFTVQLLDSTGTGVAAALAQAGGRFSLKAPAAGTYRLRVLRIGFRRTESPPFHVDASETVERRVAMAQIPVALTGIRVIGLQRCEDLPGAGEAVITVWDEVRKAMQAVALTGSERRFSMRVRDFTRDVSLTGRDVSNERSSEREGLSAHPYVSIDATTLAREGYVLRQPDGIWYYAPDADILLSDLFVSAHCFHLQRDAVSGDSLIGIAFEPVRKRPPPDIRGVLYVDRGTAELRELRYSYTALPAPAAGHDFGGRVTFQRMPGGAWITREWVVRGPVFAVRTPVSLSETGLPVHGAAAGSGRLDSTLVGAHEAGGEVLVARTTAGATVWARSYGRVVGTVTDSARGSGIAGATVELRGTLHRTRTDSAGAFRMDSVPFGAYTLLMSLQSPVRLVRSMTIRVDSAVGRVRLAPPVTTLAAGQADRDRARLAARCTELRSARDHEIDSTMAVPAAGWIPRGRDSAEVRRATTRADVVLQAVADTAGRIERASVRALRGGTSPAYATALAALLAIQPEVDEPLPGCALRRLVLLPYRQVR